MPELPDDDLIRLSPLSHWAVPQAAGGQAGGSRAGRRGTVELPPRQTATDIWALYPETLASIYGNQRAAQADSDGDVLGAADGASDRDAPAVGGHMVGSEPVGEPGGRGQTGRLPTTRAPPVPSAGGVRGPPVAFVRRGSPSRPEPPPKPPQATTDSVQSAFLRQEDAGGMAFDITLDDAVLGAMTLTIAVHEGRATARLEVADVNARRLVDAEQGRLHAALQRRGFKVDDIEVTVRPSPVGGSGGDRPARPGLVGKG